MLKILFSVIISILLIVLIHYGYLYVKNNYLDFNKVTVTDIPDDELNNELDLADDDSDIDSDATDLVIGDSDKQEMENDLTDLLNNNINDNSKN